MAGDWRSREILAFTRKDGPGQPPAAPSRWVVVSLAVVMGATFAGVMADDTLCPDHRVWVQAFAIVAVTAIAGALVAVFRGSAAAPVLALVASFVGVGIGLIELAHNTARGTLIAVGFAFAGLFAAGMVWRASRVARWEEDELASAADITVPEGVDQAVPVQDRADVPRVP
jgi:hypothetical protein